MSFARDFAIRAHGNQKYGSHPYAHHLDAVARLVVRSDGEGYRSISSFSKPTPGIRYDSMISDLAYLHDVLEDTVVSVDTLSLVFDEPLVHWVQLITDPSGETRTERKDALHKRLEALTPSDWPVLEVKLADRVANVEQCVHDDNRRQGRVYLDEFLDFEAAVWRKGLRPDLWTRLMEANAKLRELE